jgi:beta-mannanase
VAAAFRPRRIAIALATAATLALGTLIATATTASAASVTVARVTTDMPVSTKASAESRATAPRIAESQPTDPQLSSARLRFGVSTPSGARADAELDAVAAAVGEQPSIVLSFHDFGQPAPIADLESVAARGATSVITWEPWRWGGGVDQPAYANARIDAGDHDAYLTEWADALAAWGDTVYLRYGHEMNGDWYPWAEAVNGNAAGSYVDAWNHVRDLFLTRGAHNVEWVWAPNVPYPGSTPLAGLYPGDGAVSVVGLDGYNWGTAVEWSTWTDPHALLGDGLASLRALAPGKPIVITETASAEAGGSKADWNRDLVAYLDAQDDVLGFVWFDHDKEVDWRIGSSSASASGLASALAQRRG